jgi:hypothetical protein
VAVKILVLASEAISAGDLRSAVGADAADDAEVLVIAPALHESGLRFWLSDADVAITKAERVQTASVDELTDAGIDASGDTGEADQLDAVADSLRTFPADRIVVFSHKAAEEAYREGVGVGEIEKRFGLPTTQYSIER